ncbi:hypothetical protein ACFL20_03570 [Spirochaetota bacterium]
MKHPKRNDAYVDLPGDIILTHRGLSRLEGSKIKIAKINNHRGIVKEGIRSSNFHAQTLQKFVMNSFIEELYVTSPELLNKRFEIISTNNLIIYAILYKKLTPALSDMLFNSRTVKDFNRKNPKNSIVKLESINKIRLQEMMQKNKPLFDGMMSEVYNEVIYRIESNVGLSNEDKKTQTQSLDKFIAWIDNRIWYLYHIVCKTGLKDEMLSEFARMVADYLMRTQIATHLSNLLMELVQNAERAHFRRIVIKNQLTQSGKEDKYIAKRENRVKISQMAGEDNELIDLVWYMHPETTSLGRLYQVQVSVSNYGFINEIESTQIKKKMSVNVDGISLADFYGSEEMGSDGAGLGLLYNSYLEDYCKKEGIKYRCRIIPEPEREKTTVVLDITL